MSSKSDKSNIINKVLDFLRGSEKTYYLGGSPKPSATPQAKLQPVNTPIPTYSPTTDPYTGLNQVKPSGQISDLVLGASKQYDIPPAVISALLWNESGYNPNALNGEDRGIAQINKTAFILLTTLPIIRGSKPDNFS